MSASRRLESVLGHLQASDVRDFSPKTTNNYFDLRFFEVKKTRHFLRGIYGTTLDTERHGGELVAKVLQAHKIPFIFTLVGGHISLILVASKKLGIRVIDTRHEVNIQTNFILLR